MYVYTAQYNQHMVGIVVQSYRNMTVVKSIILHDCRNSNIYLMKLVWSPTKPLLDTLFIYPSYTL